MRKWLPGGYPIPEVTLGMPERMRVSGELILVAGATGALGREVIRELKARGHCVRAMARSWERLESLRGLADERVVADALKPETLRGAVDGVDRVFSCLGASVIPMPKYGYRTFSKIDYPANRNLIDAAVTARVQKFVYVSVFGADRLPWCDFVRGHERVVDYLKASGLDYGILRPTGFFSAMEEILQVANRGLLPQVNGGMARTNPIHEADLAVVCADALWDDVPERDVGGPEALTRKRIAELACQAVGREGRLLPVPVGVLAGAGRLFRPFCPRVGHLFTFIAKILMEDFVAPAYGTRTIGDYFQERVAAKKTTG